MAVPLSHMVDIVREGMDHYWRVVYSSTDGGLDATELKWKRDHERDMASFNEKHGHQFDKIFGKG